MDIQLIIDHLQHDLFLDVEVFQDKSSYLRVKAVSEINVFIELDSYNDGNQEQSMFQNYLPVDIVLADEESLVGEYNPVDVNEGEYQTLLTAMSEFDYPLEVVFNRYLRDLARVEARSRPLPTHVLTNHLRYNRRDHR